MSKPREIIIKFHSVLVICKAVGNVRMSSPSASGLISFGVSESGYDFWIAKLLSG